MPATHFPNGFKGGVEVLGMPVLNAYWGKIFWVDSATGSDSNKGTRNRPFATLDAAIGDTRANKGDIIMVAPNHAETITGVAGIALDVAGVTVVGLGSYNQRPRFLMDGGTTVTCAITAADVSLKNLVFASGHADVVAAITVVGKGAWIDQCEFVNNIADENFVTEIKATSTVDNNADGLKVTNCRAVTADASAAEMIELNADVAELVVDNNVCLKDAGTAATLMLVATGKDLQNLQVTNNMAVVGATSGDCFIDADGTANSGVVAYNLMGNHDADSAVPIVMTGARMAENYSIGVNAASALLLPAVDDNS